MDQLAGVSMGPCWGLPFPARRVNGRRIASKGASALTVGLAPREHALIFRPSGPAAVGPGSLRAACKADGGW